MEPIGAKPERNNTTKLLHGLNPAQADAVTQPIGPVVVYAGAGSGKTRVIVHRIAYLIHAMGVAPYQILAVTFTNKAARQMKDRLYRLIGPQAESVWMGTFHSICARLLRLYHAECGVDRRFVIYDDSDQRTLVTRVIKAMQLDEKQYEPKTVAHSINRFKQECVLPSDVQTRTSRDENIKQVYINYQAQLEQANALDFDDLILRFVVAMRRNPAFSRLIQHRFAHLLVDEFQDTNRVQFEWVASMMGAQHQSDEPHSIFVVGDDDQSIYAWRGADRRNIRDFNRTFLRAKIVKLEQNYRSTQRILRAANAVIQHGNDREPKELWTENHEGEPIQVIACIDEQHEADQLITAVKEFKNDGFGLSDMALLYRIHAQSRVFEEALRAANLPYRIVGGIRFYDRAEIKDVLAYLKIVHNPHDDVNLLRIINTPARGIGKTTIEKITGYAYSAGRSVWSVITSLDENPISLNSGTQAKLGNFTALIHKLRDVAEHHPHAVAPVAEAMIDYSEYGAALAEDPSVENMTRWQNIQELLGSMKDFDREYALETHDEADGTPTLTAFLERVTLQAEPAAQAEGSDMLTLMTVHGAKGLEFPVVFIAGLEESLFPFKGYDSFEDSEEMDEERRLAYVAITRAEKKLLLSFCTSRRLFGQMKSNRPSRFLLELPKEDLVERRLSHHHAGIFARPVTIQSGWSSPSPASSLLGPSTFGLPTESRVVYEEEEHVGNIYRGMQVSHGRFGIGRVQAVENGTPPKVTVKFLSVGIKQVVASFLKPV